MAIGVGIDIGSVSLKAAVVVSKNEEKFLGSIASDGRFKRLYLNGNAGENLIWLSDYRRIKGEPINAVKEILDFISRKVSEGEIFVSFTGSGGKLAGAKYNTPSVNEFSAIIEAVNLCHPEVRTVFEMGGESSKYILLDKNNGSSKLSIIDYGTNGDCAAGTGAFMDQQSSRLKFKIEDIGDIVVKASKSAQIAGRCSVFAKSDMIHAQQRGYKPDEVLKGLCNAVTRNFRSVISKGKKIVPPVLFIGGVAQNKGMIQSVRDVFGLDERDVNVPDEMCYLGAIGAAIRAVSGEGAPFKANDSIAKIDTQFPYTNKLTLDNVVLLREKITPFEFPKTGEKIAAFLGIDIGSVSTNLVVIDNDGNVIKEIYTRTNARPIEVVGEGLREIEREIGDKIEIIGAATTGSGRELIGVLIGADTINDEITAHKTGALHISRKMLGEDVDTIFEIGGQDSKYISIEDGIVVDFTMNDACAAGTGSFLEEQAEDLGVNIKGEFSSLAMSSENPIKLGERCTVFMGRDVNSFMQRGAVKSDIMAGLAYSVVYNYLNRVVRDRKIGEKIFFQGGTAYNDSVAAAFGEITGKKITVPPYNGVIGAIGVALLAKRKMESPNSATSFKGFDISKIDYNLKEFTCKGCTNYCTVQEFVVDGEKTYWGDKCSEKYRKRKKVSAVPVIRDLLKFREELMLNTSIEKENSGPVVGIPLSMYTYDRLPFFRTYLSECGFSTILSDQTNTYIANSGIESIVSEPCYPITVAHGHIKFLIDKDVEYIWLPNMINSETELSETESYVCIWGSTLPFIIEHSSAFHPYRNKLIKPPLHFRDGEKVIKKELFNSVEKLGISRKVSDIAAEKAYAAQKTFRESILDEGRKTIDIIKKTGSKAIVLIGRPYNVYDRAINLSVASKLATIYGINVIPMEFLDIEGLRFKEINSNMYWNYGKKILQTAVKLSQEPNIDVIYITNFKCGPDSFVKQFVREALGKPLLMLQFDGHSNDAGMMTRCEAYLDSKGFFGS